MLLLPRSMGLLFVNALAAYTLCTHFGFSTSGNCVNLYRIVSSNICMAYVYYAYIFMCICIALVALRTINTMKIQPYHTVVQLWLFVFLSILFLLHVHTKYTHTRSTSTSWLAGDSDSLLLADFYGRNDADHVLDQFRLILQRIIASLRPRNSATCALGDVWRTVGSIVPMFCVLGALVERQFASAHTEA